MSGRRLCRIKPGFDGKAANSVSTALPLRLAGDRLSSQAVIGFLDES
jgi:hypothetical protein